MNMTMQALYDLVRRVRKQYGCFRLKLSIFIAKPYFSSRVSNLTEV